ncbi:uncharacterized protein [Epargyreus clarus]|uniref:uncharacterized protein n=1 Tax=Epargyreus clarus TaxID=520877 RepID=UPI003C2F0497
MDMCINCGISLNRLERHLALELDTRVISLIAVWINPKIVMETDYVCEACRTLALRTINISLSEGDGASTSHHSVGHTKVCILCGRSVMKRQSNAVLRTHPTSVQQNIASIVSDLIQPSEVTSSSQLCQACWLKLKRRASRQQQSELMEEEVINQLNEDPNIVNAENSILSPSSPVRATVEQTVSPSVVEPAPPAVENSLPAMRHSAPTAGTGIILNNYKRAANTASHCIFPECTSNSLHRVSDSLRFQILIDHKFYVPRHARICDNHVRSNLWGTLYESQNSYSTFDAEHVEHVFSFLNQPNPDFNNVLSMEDHLFFYWLGLSKENFRTILNEVPQIQTIKRGIVGLSGLLIKLRTGDSDERIASLMKIPRRTLEGLINKIRDILMLHFVPRNLGIENITREQLLCRNRVIPNGVFNNENNSKAIVICDGTYIYINKSSNYMFQKDTYSLHKYKNLLKPFLIVSCDGYIVDCFGPYKATTSDAEIMISLFRDTSCPLRAYFQENDIFILDRGFRDSISLLEECRYEVHMPESLLEGEHQLTTQQANQNRCITICRWVAVEVVNGYFKRDFKLFRQDYFNRSLPHMMQNFQIAASILNKFALRIQDRPEASEIVQIINSRINLQNNLADFVETNNMNRRSSNFVSITADLDNVLDFPRMLPNDLIFFALGTYQIKQARSYFGEHIRSHGRYLIEVCRELNVDTTELNLGNREVYLIRGKIKSRHVGRRQYFVYIIIDSHMSGRHGILGYCCNCLVGRRTVGCCAHVMTLVWYLGWARYESNIRPPAEFLDEIVIQRYNDE